MHLRRAHILFCLLALLLAAGCGPETGSDVTPPTILSVVPANGADGVATVTTVVIAFSESMDVAAVQGAFSLTGSAALTGGFAWSEGDTVLTWSADAAFEEGTLHTVSVGTGATDAAGNALEAAWSSTFTTASASHGDPITGSLVINAGDWTTNFAAVSLAVTTDGATEMRFGGSLTAVASATWETLAATRAWTLEATEGTQTVYGELRKGEEVLALSDSIYYNASFSNDTDRKLTASDHDSNDNLGYAVAASADGRVIVASTIRKDGVVEGTTYADAGQVYIYVESEGAWGEAQILNDFAAYASEFYGRSVAISDDGSVIVVGAMYKDGGTAAGAGAVYVYRRSGGTWSAEGKIAPVDGVALDRFGTSVAISGDGAVIVVGAQNKTVGTNAAQGQVYVYTVSGTEWGTPATLTASDGAAGDGFGISVATNTDGSAIAVGCDLAAKAYVYSGSGSSWTQAGPIAPASAGTPAIVSLSGAGDVLAMGSYGYDSGKGVVNVYTGAEGAWTSSATILGSEVDASTYLYLGRSVSLSRDGRTLVSGAYGYAGDGSTTGRGAAWVFTSTDGTWAEKEQLLAFDGLTNDGSCFGYAVSISGDGNLIVVGAYLDCLAVGDYSGSSYIFD